MRLSSLLFVLCAGAVFASCSSAISTEQVPTTAVGGSAFAVIHSFRGVNDGEHPIAGLVAARAADGTTMLYGTTYYGGPANSGTIFRISPSGQIYGLVRIFAGRPDGAHPLADLVVRNGVLYGTTVEGGSTPYFPCSVRGCGTVFKIAADATGYTVMHSFDGGGFPTPPPGSGIKVGSDGAYPRAAVTFVGDTLYGTTAFGSVSPPVSPACLHPGCGTVFEITSAGKERLLYSFGANDAGAIHPETALTPLNGRLYGTTAYVFAEKYGGSVFSMKPAGGDVGVFIFDHGGPAKPEGALIPHGGLLYGTTAWGGEGGCGLTGCGTVFWRKPDTHATTFYSFHHTNGSAPEAGLTNVGGVLYGTTYWGGANNEGTIFKIGASGIVTLHSFDRINGAHPRSGLTLLDGTLYGTTEWGGANNKGTVFKLTP